MTGLNNTYQDWHRPNEFEIQVAALVTTPPQPRLRSGFTRSSSDRTELVHSNEEQTYLALDGAADIVTQQSRQTDSFSAADT
jgi:hypothetical protein